MQEHQFDGNVTLIQKSLRSGASPFTVDGLLSIHKSSARIFGSCGTSVLASGVLGGDLHEDGLPPYPDDDDGDGWDFADVPFHSHVDVHARLVRGFDTVYKFFHSANVAVPKNASRVLSLAWQSVMAITGRGSVEASNAVALECMRAVEETASASLVNWTLEKIDMVLERDRWHAIVERLSTDLTAL